MEPHRGYSLVVGVGSFGGRNDDDSEDSFRPLGFAEARAREVADALKCTGHVAHVPDPVLDPSWGELEGHLRQALAALGPDGVVIVHVISHGWLGSRIPDLYVATTDGENLDNCFHVEDWLKTVENKDDSPRVLLLLDVCSAGAAIERLSWRPPSGAARRTWVLGAAMADQSAHGGRFSLAVSAVLDDLAEDGLGTQENLPYVSLDLFARRVKEKLAEICLATKRPWQDLCCTAEDLSTVLDLPFFPNPGYISDPLALCRKSQQKALAGFVDSLDPILDAQHYMGKASGDPGARGPSLACHFTGRAPELATLAAWLGDESTEPLCLVTGSAGTGKSALIGVQVCSAHPQLRVVAEALQSKIDDACRSDPVESFAAVHASSMTLTDVVAGIARQLGLSRESRWTARDLILALQADTRRPVIVIDALDEAERPRDLAEVLVVPLLHARKTHSPEASVCRLLIGCRPGSVLDAVDRRVNVRTRLVDLDSIPAVRLREEVRTYLRTFLASTGMYTSERRGQIAAALASALADSDQEEPEGRVGMFLGAALLTAQMSDPHTVEELLATPPRTLAALVEGHLAKTPDPASARQVLTAIASAADVGMARSLIESICGTDTEPPRQVRKRVVVALEHTRPYWRSSATSDGTEVYRLSHRELVDHFHRAFLEGK